MRIGQFSDSYPPIINGVSAFVAEHHSQLCAQNHAAHVFTFGYSRTRDTQPNIWRSLGLPIFTSGFRLNLWMNERANRAADALDVYHAHEPFMAGLQALRFAKKHGRPFVFTNHTRHDMYIKNYARLVQPAFQRGMSSFIATAVNNSDISTAPSEETAQLLREIAPNAAHKVRVVRNGIRLDSFDNTSDCEAREDLGIGCDSTVFMYVGRLTPEKSLPVFAEALKCAVRAGVDAHWVVIGDGPCRDDLLEQLESVADHAHFLGAVPRERVAKLLAHGRCVCHALAQRSESRFGDRSVGQREALFGHQSAMVGRVQRSFAQRHRPTRLAGRQRRRIGPSDYCVVQRRIATARHGHRSQKA